MAGFWLEEFISPSSPTTGTVVSEQDVATWERGGGACAPLHFGQISQVLLEEGEEGGQVVLVGVGVSQTVSLPGVNLRRKFRLNKLCKGCSSARKL